MTNSTRKIVDMYWKAVNGRDWNTFESLIDENILYDLPQTRERIRGKKAFRTFNENYPGDWTLSIVDLIADEKQAISRIAFMESNEEQTGITFFEIQDDLINKIVEYWPNSYDPPPRNTDDIERY